jgi:hypothetical protein
MPFVLLLQAWTMMMTEVLAVSGITMSISVSAVFGVISIYLFGSISMALCAVMAIVGIIMVPELVILLVYIECTLA